jgi:hypothetical protein
MTARALVLTGGLGTGKTALAQEVVAVAAERQLAVAAIDLDWLGWVTGAALAPDQLIERNLRAVANNFTTAGVQHLVLARALLSARAYAGLRDALLDWEVFTVHLVASAATARRRLRRRDTGVELEGHLAELDRMAARVAAAAPAAPVLTTDSRRPRELALEAMRLAGWIEE